MQCLAPTGLRKHTCKNIGDIYERRDQENLFRGLVVSLHDHQPHKRRANRNRDELGNVKQMQRSCDADELGNDVGKVDHHQHQHQQKCQPQAELFADQAGEALAGNYTHPRVHLLDDRERYGDGDHGPKQVVPVLGACLAVSEDAAGVVIYICGNEPRAEDGQEQQYPDSPTLQHARPDLRWIHLEFPHRP